MTVEIEYKKITMRFKKQFLKDLKHYAIEHDTTVTDVLNKACNEFLNRNMKHELIEAIKEYESKAPQ